MMGLNQKEKEINLECRDLFDPLPAYYIPLEHRCTFFHKNFLSMQSHKDQCLCITHGTLKMLG